MLIKIHGTCYMCHPDSETYFRLFYNSIGAHSDGKAWHLVMQTLGCESMIATFVTKTDGYECEKEHYNVEQRLWTSFPEILSAANKMIETILFES